MTGRVGMRARELVFIVAECRVRGTINMHCDLAASLLRARVGMDRRAGRGGKGAFSMDWALHI